MGAFKAVIRNESDKQHLMLSGHLNEQAAQILPALLPQLHQVVVVNFKALDNINSYGVHAWIGFFGLLALGRKIFFDECTPEVVAQMNMIPFFRGKAEVRSVYGPYTCTSCGHYQQHLFTRGKNMPDSPSGPVEKVACTKCGKPSSMDVVSEDFFSFLD